MDEPSMVVYVLIVCKDVDVDVAKGLIEIVDLWDIVFDYCEPFSVNSVSIRILLMKGWMKQIVYVKSFKMNILDKKILNKH